MCLGSVYGGSRPIFGGRPNTVFHVSNQSRHSKLSCSQWTVVRLLFHFPCVGPGHHRDVSLGADTEILYFLFFFLLLLSQLPLKMVASGLACLFDNTVSPPDRKLAEARLTENPGQST